MRSENLSAMYPGDMPCLSMSATVDTPASQQPPCHPRRHPPTNPTSPVSTRRVCTPPWIPKATSDSSLGDREQAGCLSASPILTCLRSCTCDPCRHPHYHT